jgi:4-hydroxy 2-oxovalerate aldolase
MNSADRTVTVVDATLRDGGYANSYGFTPEHVTRVLTGLRDAGLTMVEIGHGYGLGAERTMGEMAASVAEYLQAAAGVTGPRVGMFANAGITADADIVAAAAEGLDFVRIGCIGFDDPHPFREAIRLAAVAKENGLWTSVNLVRTQFLTASELDDVAKTCSAAGVDAVYVVDSPGGSLPDDVRRSVQVLRDPQASLARPDDPSGFGCRRRAAARARRTTRSARCG